MTRFYIPGYSVLVFGLSLKHYLLLDLANIEAGLLTCLFTICHCSLTRNETKLSVCFADSLDTVVTGPNVIFFFCHFSSSSSSFLSPSFDKLRLDTVSVRIMKMIKDSPTKQKNIYYTISSWIQTSREPPHRVTLRWRRCCEFVALIQQTARPLSFLFIYLCYGCKQTNTLPSPPTRLISPDGSSDSCTESLFKTKGRGYFKSSGTFRFPCSGTFSSNLQFQLAVCLRCLP